MLITARLYMNIQTHRASGQVLLYLVTTDRKSKLRISTRRLMSPSGLTTSKCFQVCCIDVVDRHEQFSNCARPLLGKLFIIGIAPLRIGLANDLNVSVL